MPDLPDLGAAKSRLGIRTAVRDAEITRLLGAAIGLVEDWTGHLLTRRSHKISGTAGPLGAHPIRLHVSPLHAVVGMSFLDRAGDEVPIADPFLVAPEGQAALVYPPLTTFWPSMPYGYSLEVDAGYPAGEVPEQLIQAVLLLVGHWFENHEAVVVGTSAVELPIGVRDLCSNFRAPGFE